MPEQHAAARGCQWLPPTAFTRTAAARASRHRSRSQTIDAECGWRGRSTSRRGLRDLSTAQDRYPADIWNINNAARNLVEIIANAARSDTGGDYPIRIYTIGMGELVRCSLGTRQEMSEDMLKRIANDKTSPDFNPRSSKASTTSRRRRTTSARRSRRCRTRSSG